MMIIFQVSGDWLCRGNSCHACRQAGIAPTIKEETSTPNSPFAQSFTQMGGWIESAPTKDIIPLMFFVSFLPVVGQGGEISLHHTILPIGSPLGEAEGRQA